MTNVIITILKYWWFISTCLFFRPDYDACNNIGLTLAYPPENTVDQMALASQGHICVDLVTRANSLAFIRNAGAPVNTSTFSTQNQGILNVLTSGPVYCFAQNHGWMYMQKCGQYPWAPGATDLVCVITHEKMLQLTTAWSFRQKNMSICSWSYQQLYMPICSNEILQNNSNKWSNQELIWKTLNQSLSTHNYIWKTPEA